MSLLYTLSVRSYTLAIRMASLWNAKAKEWVQGRKDVWKAIENFQASEKVVWFHCASLGEFEQGRPLMEKMKLDGYQVIVTFFSPSGYRIRKNYEGADLITYLPVDTKKNADRFIKKIKPSKVIFVKYEFWANHLYAAKKNGAELFLISALFRPNQIFFKWYGGYMRTVLSWFKVIFVQNEASLQQLKTIGLNAVIAGDTRYDRVMENANKVVRYPLVDSFCSDKKIFVAGSVWAEDMEIVAPLVNQLSSEWKVILASHEIKESAVQLIESQLTKKTSRYSSGNADADVLIIDNVGMLMNLYAYGDMAYVGGAFRTGLHNILEPAAFGLPVIFGPKTDKFPEAELFKAAEIAKQVSSQDQLIKAFNEFASLDMKENVKSFMLSNTGATEIILNTIA